MLIEENILNKEVNSVGQCDNIQTTNSWSVIKVCLIHADQSSCFSCSSRSELRLRVGGPPTAQAQVHLHRLITRSTSFEVISYRIHHIQENYTLRIVFHTASTQTKDCLQLLKLLGVPVIQVCPLKHRIYMFVFCPYGTFTSCIFILISLSSSLSCAPGSRGCWGAVCPAGERGDCGRCGLRGHGHSAVWSQYSHSPAERQEGQVRTVQLMCCTGVFLCGNPILSINYIHAGNFPNHTIEIYVVKCICPTRFVCTGVFLEQFFFSFLTSMT